ncbi:MAG: type III pantothenate kinase [bacterium]|nr:type III pantothenate kinase [bacterium]
MHKCKYIGVDIGNSGLRAVELSPTENSLGSATRIRWCFPQHNATCDEDRIVQQTATSRFAPDSPQWLGQLSTWLEAKGRLHWMISSVRSDACQILLDAIEARGSQSFTKVSHADLPLQVETLQPHRVGIDRLLAAMGAVEAMRVRGRLTVGQETPLIVIQAGSAVTVDLVTSSDQRTRFQGGAIVPGVPMMLRLLGQAADQLPEVDADALLGGDLREMPPLPGKNTEQAMLCGVASALVGGVMHLVSRYRDMFHDIQPEGLLPVILSGGDGPRLAPYISEPLLVEPDLVQRGLLALVVHRSIPKADV